MENPVGQAAHLGVAAFARVLTQSVGQSGYLLEGPKDCGLDGTAAKATTGLGTVGRKQFPRLAEGTDHVVRSGG
jgi:hypothetical protein